MESQDFVKTDKSTLTIVETLYHQSSGEDPLAYQHSFYRILETNEQPYSRVITVSEELTLIDGGWIVKEKQNTIRIHNKSNEYSISVFASTREVQDTITPFTIIPPRESVRFYLCPTVNYYLSAPKKSKCSLLIIPS